MNNINSKIDEYKPDALSSKWKDKQRFSAEEWDAAEQDVRGEADAYVP